jgi:hypothetical protein
VRWILNHFPTHRSLPPLTLVSPCSVQVLASPTENMGTLLTAAHNVSIGGAVKFSNALQVAQLALKHRRNKTGS